LPMKALLNVLKRTRYPWPWTDVYGVARSLIALGTLGTLLTHDASLLFMPSGQTMIEIEPLGLAARFTLFFLVPTALLPAARWFAIGALLLVISGWRPRWTGLLHW